eukprot:7930974-Alexandrium_andersonii.AAC.1
MPSRSGCVPTVADWSSIRDTTTGSTGLATASAPGPTGPPGSGPDAGRTARARQTRGPGPAT